MFDNFIVSCDEIQHSGEPQDSFQAEDFYSDEAVICSIEADKDADSIADVCPENNLENIEKEDGETDIQESAVESVLLNDIIEVTDTTEEKIELKYSQEEVDSFVKEAEARARELGYNDGFSAATSEIQKMQQSVLEDIGTKISALVSDSSNIAAASEAAAIKVALEAVHKILPSLERDVAKKELIAFLGDNFNKFKNESGLSFNFNPQMAAEIAPQLSKLAEKHDFEGKISIHKDADMSLSDCKVEWKNGGVERNITKVLNKIEELIS